MRSYIRGFTLIELVLSLAILAFLLVNLAAPLFSYRRTQMEVGNMMTELQNSIAMARFSAISENVMVTFCRSNDGQHCQGSWRDGNILFTDINADHALNGADRLLFRNPAIKATGALSFNSFKNRQYLQLTPRGITNFQNGNFTFCPRDGDMQLARQLIVSFSGKTRMARDEDGDGIVENSQGKNVICN
jgi:type IV fimbrial biogenesis protein FimT